MDDARRTRSSGSALLASGLLLVAVVLGAGTPASAEDATVAATGSNTFSPNRVAILVGDSVTWSTSGGVNHTVTSASANWRKDDQISLVGQSTSFTFSRAGTYAYYCRTHGSPTAGMRGTVVVSGPTAASPTRTTAAPKPTPKPSTSASPTRSPTPRPTPSRTPAASPSARPTPSRTPSPAQTRSAAPIGFPTSVPAPARTSAAPLPTVAESESPSELVDLGSGGLGPRPSTGRGRGLPTFLALVALGGVVSAQIRAL
ncbi:MAG TPA: plastocyanin/azurin family copper-binding protein, partial [Mycobacteriales bacterium]|nr:plastocyanin/azurin family copper-binding protein [Mycobacteriales bacterium]